MKEKIKKIILATLYIILAIGIFVVVHTYLNLGFLYNLILTVILISIIGCCWDAWQKNKKGFTKRVLWGLITVAIIIALAKIACSHWSCIAIYGGLVFLWGYFLRGIIDECYEKNNQKTKSTDWGE